MSLGNFALFCSHAAGLGAQFQHLLLVLLVSCCRTGGRLWRNGTTNATAVICSGGSFNSSASVAKHPPEDWQKGNSVHWTVGEKCTASRCCTFYPVVTDWSSSQLFIPAVATVACFPSNLPVFMLMCILMGFSVATIFLLPW